jgi:hypothetical protein
MKHLQAAETCASPIGRRRLIVRARLRWTPAARRHRPAGRSWTVASHMVTPLILLDWYMQHGYHDHNDDFVIN